MTRRTENALITVFACVGFALGILGMLQDIFAQVIDEDPGPDGLDLQPLRAGVGHPPGHGRDHEYILWTDQP